MSLNEMKNTAKEFGCHDLVCLDDNSFRTMDYLDLLKIPEEIGFTIDAVAEFQSRPVLYIVYGDYAQSSETGKTIELQRLLANRGERAYLGFLRPGELEIRPINLEWQKLKDINPIKIKSQAPEAPAFFQSVASGAFSMAGTPENPDFVFKSIFDLMTKSSSELINKFNLAPLDVLSCIGRSLFFRFLRDRKIILEKELPELISPKIKSWQDCFADMESSISICNWLDSTFNGDLLPFSRDKREFFTYAAQNTDNSIFLHMQAILLGWEHVGNGSFQLSLDWDDLNFAHIPIGVLSQVYEQFSRIWDERQAQSTSVFYTPKSIAKYLVEDAFASLSDKKNARILDPSCGAGIFLVLAFRTLVRSYWEREHKRPDTRAIQNILYKQLCGFDISESALRLTALSLYITAIELNKSPRPPKSLKFPKPLQGTVLFNHRKPDEKDVSGFVLGSLRNDLPCQFDNSFDLVIGNPPWSRLKENNDNEEDNDKNKEFNDYFTSLTKSILKDRGLHELSSVYKNPDNNPDLPFLWQATKWAKSGGIIAMILPSRIFLKQTDAGKQAFSAILQGLEITGILNGSNLSDTAVWPDMQQPFMLFFTRNKRPAPDHRFYFATPQFERQLNNKGYLRIDYNAAQPVLTKDAISYSWLLKTLAIGTILDVEISKKLHSNTERTIETYWDQHNLIHGRGYDISPKQKRQSDASFLIGMPDFTRIPKKDFVVDISHLHSFKREKLHAPRVPELYTAPILIVPEAPGSKLSPKSFFIRKPVAFSKSYYGFSAKGHQNESILIAFLHLLTHSSLFKYFTLMTSSRFGTERRTFLKETLEHFPFPDFDSFSSIKNKRILELSEQLENAEKKPWDELNSFIFELYGWNDDDLQVVEDTLAVGLPYKNSRDLACKYPTRQEENAFYSYLKKMLEPAFEITGEKIKITPINLKSKKIDFSSPWIFFSISSSATVNFSLSCNEERVLINQALKKADKTGCSRVIVQSESKLLVGLLGQYRYWTLSRARLCALHIIHNHLDVFPVGRKS